MTGEEMERALEFLVKSQADTNEQLEQLTGQVAETNRLLQLQAETQSQFIEIVTVTMNRLADAQERTAQQIAQQQTHANETDARLDRLAALVERHIEDEHAHR
jgi:methyl-accepting chemotaxis protein